MIWWVKSRVVDSQKWSGDKIATPFLSLWLHYHFHTAIRLMLENFIGIRRVFGQEELISCQGFTYLARNFKTNDIMRPSVISRSIEMTDNL